MLPVLHCNKFKISEKTISGTMDDRELLTLFTGYGYQASYSLLLCERESSWHTLMQVFQPA